jgi:hypothetical protein
METAEVPAAEGFLSFFMYVYPVYPLKNNRDLRRHMMMLSA